MCKKRKIAIILVIIIACLLTALFPLASAEVGDGLDFGNGLNGITATPAPISPSVISSAQVMASFMVILAVLVGFGAVRSAGLEEEESAENTGFFGSTGSLIGYVVAIAFLLIMAAVFAGWKM